MSLRQRSVAEFLGTFWLVFGGCGSAVLAAAFPGVGIGLLGVSLAFGLTVLTMAYAIGHISGCHLNPAVSIGLVTARRFPAAELPAYIIAQVLGGIAGAATLYVNASGKPGFDIASGLASNGYGVHSPGGYSLFAGLVLEVVLTFFFLMVILRTDARPPASPLSRSGSRSPSSILSVFLLQMFRSTLPAAPVRRSLSGAGRSSSCGCSGLRQFSVQRLRVWLTAPSDESRSP
jgi:MIP family channel proteins